MGKARQCRQKEVRRDLGAGRKRLLFKLEFNGKRYCCSLPFLAIILVNGRMQLMFNTFVLSQWQLSNHEELSPLSYYFEAASFHVLGTDHIRLK